MGTFIRRGPATEDAFSKAKTCRIVKHGAFAIGDHASFDARCSVREAKDKFDKNKSARMMRHVGGPFVFVVFDPMGYTRYELRA